MATITIDGRAYPCTDGESALDTLIEAGVDLPHSCKKGTCLTCVVRVKEGPVPPEAQAGLPETLAADRHALACQLRPKDAITIERVDDARLYVPATIDSIEPLAQRVVRVRLLTPAPFDYHAGQFVNLRRNDGLVRSYSLASVPGEDAFLELHVRRQDNGAMSTWLTHAAKPGDTIELQGPNGACFYVPGRPDQPLLLVGTGTGAAPLIGILRDALAMAHTGPIVLYHGSRHPDGLYLNEALGALALRHLNFRYVPCVSGPIHPRGTRPGRAHAVALKDHASFKGVRVFACGHPAMVHALRRQTYLAGASLGEIHGDPFDLRDLRRANRRAARDQSNAAASAPAIGISAPATASVVRRLDR